MPPDDQPLHEVLEMASLSLRDESISSSNMTGQLTTDTENEFREHTHEETMPREVAGFEILPNEIISWIFVSLTVDINSPFVVSSTTFRASRNRQRKDAHARRDLTGLCMVSRKMAANARKALYRNILITRADTLVLLYRTFLENPNLGGYVKRMSLNIDHGGQFFNNRGTGAFSSNPISLAPVLSQTRAEHGLGTYLNTRLPDNVRPSFGRAIRILYVLQFKVLSLTRNLESLDLNVHPLHFQCPSGNTTNQMEETRSKAVAGVFHPLWEETSPRLSRLKQLQLIGKTKRHCPRDKFVGLVCRSFLTLPKLETLAWFNHAMGWFDTLPYRMKSGFYTHLHTVTEPRSDSIRTIDLRESSCFPRDLCTLISRFPHLESIKVNTHSIQCRDRESTDTELPHLLGSDAKYLTESLATLENLRVLKLDLHYRHDISETLGPSGILSLAGLPNLQILAVPFNFFVRKESEYGDYKAVSPTSVLPRGLRTLRIVGCMGCLLSRIGIDILDDDEDSFDTSTYQHVQAVLEFLEGLAKIHDESFPSLERIRYEEEDTRESHESQCDCEWCSLPFIFRETDDELRLAAVSASFNLTNIEFKKCTRSFRCGYED